MSPSPFGAFTLWQYRNLAVACLATGTFLLAGGGPGFKGGVNVGLGASLVAGGIIFVVLRRYVRRRLDWPIEYWRAQQHSISGRVWGATWAIVATGALAVVFALLGGAMWLAGCATGASLLPSLLIIGKLTGQVTPI